jgi:hypothetical protein
MVFAANRNQLARPEPRGEWRFKRSQTFLEKRNCATGDVGPPEVEPPTWTTSAPGTA